MDNDNSIDAVTLATDLTIAWLGNSNTRPDASEVPAFLKSMFDAVTGLAAPVVDATPEPSAATVVGAVSARKSLASRDHLISMIDGKPYKTLRRHLSTHGFTPEEYRAQYNLKADYPMVAPAYSEARRTMAKTIGLGRKPGTKVTGKPSAPTPAAPPTPATPNPAKRSTAPKAAAPARGRPKKSA
jgi:predicted transcriptional regulator